jgi:ubiquinone/menaquinone biosynthesis C-methylase UbiE
MGAVRKPLQGVRNIIRFNWHFYLFAFGLITVLIVASSSLGSVIYGWIAWLIALPVIVSLLVSLYVYDLSGFYRLNWLDTIPAGQNIVNINAGFDEISELLHQKFPENTLTVFDFYNPELHTEVSIKRARKAYPPYTGTIAITTSSIPLADNFADKILLVFAAHEIRNPAERINFFFELNRILKPNGEIIIIEHLRDVPNFLAYTIGFLHFASRKTWYETFKAAGFNVKETKINPFVSKFILVGKSGSPKDKTYGLMRTFGLPD